MENLAIQNDSAPEISGEPWLQSPEIKGKVGPLCSVLYYPRNVKETFFLTFLSSLGNTFIQHYLTTQPFSVLLFFLKKNHSVNIPTLCKTLKSEMEAS